MKARGILLALVVVAGLFGEMNGQSHPIVGEAIPSQQVLDVLKTVQLPLGMDEILEAIKGNEVFLNVLPRVLHKVMSRQDKMEFKRAVLGILSDYASEDAEESQKKDGLKEIIHILESKDVDEILESLDDNLNWPDIPIWLKILLKLIQWLKDNYDLIIEKILERIMELIMNYIKANWDTIMLELVTVLQNELDVLLSKYYLPIGASISEECQNTTNEFFQHIFDQNSSSILNMVDSWGKLPDGFLFGNVITLGSYEECVQSETSYMRDNETEVNYRGRYCKVTYKNPKGLTLDGLSLWAKVSFAHGVFGYGTCIPSLCSEEDLTISLNETLNDLELEIASVHCQSKDTGAVDLTPTDIAMVSLISIFLIFVVLGTIFDVTTRSLDRNDLRQGFWQGIIGFSFWYNMESIFTYQERKGTDTITCLGAMRVLTTSWIIICHQYQIDMTFIANLLDSLRYQDMVPAQIITNGWLAGDTFLCLTGIVIAYRVFPSVKLEKGGRVALTFVKTFIRRFFRLAPSILFVGLFSASLLRYLAAGPIAYTVDEFADKCQDYWWRDTLFVNNYIFGESDGLHFQDCLYNCWYTAVDMQLLLILPVLLLPFAFNRIVGGIVFTAVFIGSIVVPMIITIVNDLPPTPIHFMSLKEHFEYNWRVFIVPWCRAGPWLVGILTGVLLRNQRISNLKLHKFLVFCGYVIAIVIGLVLVMGLYPYNHVKPDKDFRDNPAMSASYGSLARPVWGLCVAFVVFCCHTKNSEVVNDILSYPGWRPISKLTYTTYLVAPVVQQWWLANRFTVNYYNYLEKLFQSLGISFLSMMIALALTCFVERPICTLLNMVLPSEAAEKEDSVIQVFQKRQPEKNELIPIYKDAPDYSLPRPRVKPVAPAESSSPFSIPPLDPCHQDPDHSSRKSSRQEVYPSSIF